MICMQVCKHLSMKVCKYARGHLDPEQRGRLIGKGPLPKEKLMKALGEVSSHCEIFFLHNAQRYLYFDLSISIYIYMGLFMGKTFC